MHIHTPFLTRGLWRGALSISCLLATFGQGVDAYPQTTTINNGLNGNASVSALPPLFRTLAIVYTAVTPDRTYDPSSPSLCSLGFGKERGMLTRKNDFLPVDLSRGDVALTFINAMAAESLEPWGDRLFFFDYTIPETPVRIVLRSAPTARTATTVRSTVMWVLQQVPIHLLSNPDIRGVEFKVLANGQDLYTGKVSSRNRPAAAAGVLGHGGVQSGNSSSGSSEQNRKGSLLINQPSNTSTESLNLADRLLAGDRYVAIYEFAGLPLRDIDIFSFILKYILQLAAQDVHEVISFLYFTPSTSPIWSYARQHVGQTPTQTMHVYHIVMLLLGAARFCIGRGVYEELLMELWMNEALLVAGCVVRALDGRQWCRGLKPRLGTGAPALSLDPS